MTRKAKIALGICSVLAAGVVIALLVAPEKSKEVGNRIKKSTGKWVDKLGNILSKASQERRNYARNLTNEY
jgi:gas vesicle protein